MVCGIVAQPASPHIPGSPGECCPRLVALNRSIGLGCVTRGVRSHSSLSVNSVGDMVRGFIRGVGRRLLRNGSIGVRNLNIFVLATHSGNTRLTGSVGTGDISDIHVFFRTGGRLHIAGATAHTSRGLSLVDLSRCLGGVDIAMSPRSPRGPSRNRNNKSRNNNDKRTPSPTTWYLISW